MTSIISSNTVNHYDIHYLAMQMANNELLEEIMFLEEMNDKLSEELRSIKNTEEILPSIIISETNNLEDEIINCIRRNKNGITTIEIVKILDNKTYKKSVNSILYKLLTKKKVFKSSDNRPVWKI